MRELPLSVSAQVVLDPDGNGSVSIGPQSAGEIWQAGFNAGVRVSTTAAEAIGKVFVGGRFIGSTTWGSTGDATSDTPPVSTGQVVEARWTGGDPNATAYLDVTGIKVVG